MDKAWHLACEAEGYADGEVPDWAIQMVSDTQLEIYNQFGGRRMTVKELVQSIKHMDPMDIFDVLAPWTKYGMTETEWREYEDEYADYLDSLKQPA